MKIATWNVNSIRRRLDSVMDWARAHQPDILCLQETKVQDSEFPVDAFRGAGYVSSFHGMKGYNGVATMTRREPDIVLHEDVRIIQVVVDGIAIVNTYVPQGYKVGTDKYQAKLEWLAYIRHYFERHLDPAKPALWVGDMNVAPEPIDVYHPDRRLNDVDFHIDSRNAYQHAAAWGFIDVFRKLHPHTVQYTYWDYFRNAFENDWGWRIDHIMATAPLAAACTRAEVDVAPRRLPGSSDHTVVWAEFDQVQ